jgi:hypothetical protein
MVAGGISPNIGSYELLASSHNFARNSVVLIPQPVPSCRQGSQGAHVNAHGGESGGKQERRALSGHDGRRQSPERPFDPAGSGFEPVL